MTPPARQCDLPFPGPSDVATSQPKPAAKDVCEARNGFSPGTSEGSPALPTPRFQPSDTDSGLLASRARRKYISVVSSQPDCGHLLERQQKLIQQLTPNHHQLRAMH